MSASSLPSFLRRFRSFATHRGRQTNVSRTPDSTIHPYTVVPNRTSFPSSRSSTVNPSSSFASFSTLSYPCSSTSSFPPFVPSSSSSSSLSSVPSPSVYRSRRTFSTTPSPNPSTTATMLATLDTPHPLNNIPPSIKAKINQNLLHRPYHPLQRIKQEIEEYFRQGGGTVLPGTENQVRSFHCFDQLSPIVTVKQNFDDLLTPIDHVSRSPTDTFYVNDQQLLRCHMTAHQTTLLKEGHRAFLMVGDVYRRDTVDATHYPVFHQIDGVRVFDETELPSALRLPTDGTNVISSELQKQREQYVMDHLKQTLEGLTKKVFGSNIELRWVEAYFPFTEPSLELEIFFEGNWLEVLGSGKIRSQILRNCGTDALQNAVGWAFGMGVERLAMALYGINDIRLFWSDDERFLKQFRSPSVPLNQIKFVPYSKYPACYKDITFWLPPPTISSSSSSSPPSYHENDFYALVREVAGDLCENVTLVDKFLHPKTKKESHCYRILYRSMDRSLTNEEIDKLQNILKERVVKELNLTLR